MRYEKNGIFSSADMTKLKQANICIIGAGGLGGYILEMISRAGVGNITLIDGDVFDETNLNRQLLSNELNLGENKAEVGSKRIATINSETKVSIVDEFLSKENVHVLLKGHDVVIDGLDSIDMRKLVEKECELLNIPLVHGAIGGWFGQVATIFPGDRMMEKIYGTSTDKGIEQVLGNPSFTPALVASIQVSETIKVLLGKSETIRNKVFYIDLMSNEFYMIDK